MKKFITTIGLVLTLSACSSDNSVTGEEPGGEVPAVVRSLEISPEASQAAAAVQGYNVDFFRNVALSDVYKGKNVACSPLSATMALTMLSNAASDETAGEIAGVLGYSNTDALNNLYAALATQLPLLDPKATLTFANSVWYDKQYTLTDAFSAVANNCYKADIFKRDMTGKTPSVKEEINSWVSDKTKGLIKNIKVQMPVLSTLINAAYFNAAWQNPFCDKVTGKATFNGVNGASEIDMMAQSGEYLYNETADFKLVEMPFASGAFAATFILPSGNVEDFMKSDAFKTALALDPVERTVGIYLPRFKIAEDEEVGLTDILCDMGVKSLNNPRSFKMFNESPEVAAIKICQKTSVEFNENGAEAAAATWTGVYGSNGSSVHPPVIKLDRPFIFLITEKSTKTILFAGKIMSL